MKRKKILTWGVSIVVAVLMLLPNGLLAQQKTHRIDVLMLSDIRNDPVEGLKKGLAAFDIKEGVNAAFRRVDAGGDRDKLASLAREIVENRPDVAVAAGGVEADALRTASENTDVPVVFLAVASAIDRGLAASMKSSENNLTGIDTNDAELTAKRLWYVTKMFPAVKRILIPVIPSITPAVKAVEIAQAAASNLDIDIVVLEGEDKDAISAAAAGTDFSAIDAIYIGLAAPVWQIENTVFWPISKAQRIPIMGVNRGDLARGAVASYACSRFDAGVQAARLVQKVLSGIAPADIPVETPVKLEFVINRWAVGELKLSIPGRVWRVVDDVVEIAVK